MLVHFDSRAVVMEVELMPNHACFFLCRHEWGGVGACDAKPWVKVAETTPSADLGGSSKYSNANLED